MGRDLKRGDDVALKIAHEDHSTLRYENGVYKAIAGSRGVSPPRWFGKEGYYYVIVLEHLGTSVGDLISTQQFDHSRTFFFASQMVRTFGMYRDPTDFFRAFPQLSAVESLHTRYYIHRDIKPSNFMIRGDNTVFLIDFGLAQLIRDPATDSHILFSTNRSIVGTRPFTSISGHRGHSQSRRDDLESLAYTIIFSARGDLPWTSLSDWEAVFQKKISTTVEELCAGVPAPFRNFIRHVRTLSFDMTPNYKYLHSILSECSQIETNVPKKALAPPEPCACPAAIGDQM